MDIKGVDLILAPYLIYMREMLIDPAFKPD